MIRIGQKFDFHSYITVFVYTMNSYQDWMLNDCPRGLDLQGGFFQTASSIRWSFRPYEEKIIFNYHDKHYSFDLEASVHIKDFKKLIVIEHIDSFTTYKVRNITTFKNDFKSFLVILKYITKEILFDKFTFACFGDDWDVAFDYNYAYAS